MNLGLAHIFHPMIISSLSSFILSSCLLSYCSVWHLPFCSCCFTMWWMNGLTSHCTEDILALLGTGRGLYSFPCVLVVDIQIHHLVELKLCLLFRGSRMCILTLLLDCSAETYHWLVVDMATSNSVSPNPYNKVCVTWVELGGLSPYLHIWLLRTTHWKRCILYFAMDSEGLVVYVDLFIGGLILDSPLSTWFLFQSSTLPLPVKTVLGQNYKFLP